MHHFLTNACIYFNFFFIAPSQPQKTRADLMKDIDAEYYGYRDDDDGVLIPLEHEQEKIGKLFFFC